MTIDELKITIESMETFIRDTEKDILACKDQSYRDYLKELIRVLTNIKNKFAKELELKKKREMFEKIVRNSTSKKK